MTASVMRHSVDALLEFRAINSAAVSANDTITSSTIDFDLLSAYWDNGEQSGPHEFAVFGYVDDVVVGGGTLTFETSVTGAFGDTVTQLSVVKTAVGPFHYVFTREQILLATKMRIVSTPVTASDAAGFWAYMAPVNR